MDQWGRGNLETMKPLVTQSEILGTQILDALTDILSIKHTPTALNKRVGPKNAYTS